MILRFPNETVAENFVALLASERPDIFKACSVLEALKGTVVLKNIHKEQEEWVKRNLNLEVKKFDNVQFSPFGQKRSKKGVYRKIAGVGCVSLGLEEG